MLSTLDFPETVIFVNVSVPGPVEHIKALVMTSDSVLVAWSRPLQPNGVIVKYTVYRAQRPARQVGQELTTCTCVPTFVPPIRAYLPYKRIGDEPLLSGPT